MTLNSFCNPTLT